MHRYVASNESPFAIHQRAGKKLIWFCIETNIEPIFIVTNAFFLINFFLAFNSLLVARYLYNIPAAMQSRAHMTSPYKRARHETSFFQFFPVTFEILITEHCLYVCVHVFEGVRTMQQQLFGFIYLIEPPISIPHSIFSVCNDEHFCNQFFMKPFFTALFWI